MKELHELTEKEFNILKKEFHCFYDDSGSIGKRYARQDESGTPYCITIDFDSLKKPFSINSFKISLILDIFFYEIFNFIYCKIRYGICPLLFYQENHLFKFPYIYF